MKNEKCSFCGSMNYTNKTIDYLYSHSGKYLLVPDTPVEICDNCGMVYYDAKILLDIEKHFFAIQNKEEIPDSYIEIPKKNLNPAFA
jgi:YgiT-type zinc finger domain-containing protein